MSTRDDHRAIVVSRHGGPEVLRLERLPSPPPGPGEVAVTVAAAGVNFADVLARLGVYAAAPPPPFVPGIEIAGTVETLGPGVGGLRRGDRVTGFCPFGGYAERTVTRESYLLPIPDDLAFDQAAALPVQYLTAWYALEHLGRIEVGETVLVTAAAGGVGRAALELARGGGARIVALVGSEDKVDTVRAAAPDARVEVSRRGDLGTVRDERFDVVLDGVGGRTFRQSWKRLAPGGRYVLFGAATAITPGRLSRLAALWRLLPMAWVRPLGMITANRSLHAFNLFFLADRKGALLRRAMEDLLARWRRGEIRPLVASAQPLEAAPWLHRELQERRTVGKLVLAPRAMDADPR